MPVHAEKYTDNQRAAVAQYGLQHPAATAPAIATLAAEGALAVDGETVAPFEIPPATVRSIRTRGKRRAEKQAREGIAALPPRDAVEGLRRELLAATEEKLARVQRQIRSGRHDKVSGDDLRQIARAVREIAAIPGPEGRPAQAPRPGHGPVQERDSPETRGGMAAQALRAHELGGYKTPAAPVRSDPLPTILPTETATPAPTTDTDRERIFAADGGDPGSYARAAIDAMTGQSDATRPAP